MGRNDLLPEEKMLMAQMLLIFGVDGKLSKGKVRQVAIRFDVAERTIYAAWAHIKQQTKLGNPLSFASKKLGIEKTKRVLFDLEKMKGIEFSKRKTIRKLGVAMGVSKSTIGRWNKKGVIKHHTNAIHPALSPKNQLSRLKFCISALYFDEQTCTPKFKSMTHDIHVDEKWIYITKCNQKYYIYPGEQEPYRACQSKRFITKVIFICAVTRPLYNDEGEMIFDGKIGMWLFSKIEPAKRNSRNRVAGTLVTRPLDSVNKEVTKDILNQVISAIKSKWPQNSSKDITIQWDNAPPHITNNDPEFISAASEDGFNIQINFQPPNSPDTNINDLGWFRSIDSLKDNMEARTVEELIKAVEDSYEKLSHKTLNYVFLSLQKNMKNIMKVKGGNDFKLSHIGKEALDRRGELPDNIVINPELVRECILYLEAYGQAEGLEGMMAAMELTRFTL